MKPKTLIKYQFIRMWVRATAYILQKSINNYSKKREYWGRRGLGGLDIYIYISEIPRDPACLTIKPTAFLSEEKEEGGSLGEISLPPMKTLGLQLEET